MKSINAILVASLLSVGVVTPVVSLAAVHAAKTAVVAQPSVQKIDINAADATALAAVPGMTKHAAHAIVAYREAHGPFKSVDDLAAVDGVNKKVLEKIAASLTV